MKSKVKFLAFNQSIKSWQLWASAFAYHIATLLIYRVLPSTTIQQAHQAVFEKPEAIKNIAITNLTKHAVNKQSFINIATIINVLLFDAIFIAIFLTINRTKTKRHSPFAVTIAIIMVNLFFYLYFRSLLIHLTY